MRISHFTALLLACVLLFLPTVGLAVPSSLSVAVVADDHLALRPLELNQRDVVSLLGLVYEGLFEMDDNAQPQPKLAYAYSFSNDGRKLQVTLRQDITFHNGEALTSADVIATLDYMLELSGFDDNLDSETPVDERGLYYSTFYSIRSWEATDDYTVVFTLRRASYGSLYALTFPILPVSQVASDMPSGTGPYKYDGYEQGSAIWLTANDAWWNRAPQVRYIRASIYDTADQALNAFDTQSVDIAMTRSINASRYSGSLNTFSLNARTRQLEVLLVNRAYKDFKSDDNGQNLLRQAIAYAINRSELISSAYQNMATVAYTPIPSGTWLSNESAIRDIYDPLMAASLLDSAGYKLADDGNRYKDGKKMEKLRILVYDEPGSTARTNAANKIVDRAGRRRHPGLRGHLVTRRCADQARQRRLFSRPVRPEFRRFPRSRLHADLHRQLQLYALPLQRHERPHHPAAQELHRRQLSKRDAAHSGSVRAGSAVYLPVLALSRSALPRDVHRCARRTRIGDAQGH